MSLSSADHGSQECLLSEDPETAEIQDVRSSVHETWSQRWKSGGSCQFSKSWLLRCRWTIPHNDACLEKSVPDDGEEVIVASQHSWKTTTAAAWNSIKTWPPSIFWFCVPSFLKSDSPPPQTACTALDGLRGYASLGVFTLHFFDTYCQEHNKGWGLDTGNYYLYQLPFIHFFFNAGSLVACFFVISGYVLSYKPLKLIHAGEHSAFLTSMRSSIFRRGIRLFVPMIIAITISGTLVRLYAFEHSRQIYADGWINGAEDAPPRFDSFSEQLKDVFNTFWTMTHPFYKANWSPGYDPHLFTIPAEFKGSMILFLVTIGVSGMQTKYRLAFIAAWICYLAWYTMNEALLFFIGMFLCDVDHLLRSASTASAPPLDSPPPDATTTPNASTTKTSSTHPRILRLRFFWLLLFIPGLYCAGLPSWDALITPGYITMMHLMNNWFRWNSIGCALLVWTARNSPDLQIIYTNRFAQYLGRISFAMYIVHGNVRRLITYPMVPALYYAMGDMDLTKKTQNWVSIGVSGVITYAVVFLVADIWWRGVDLPSIRFARWVERKVFERK